jgi:hypothetical protein
VKIFCKCFGLKILNRGNNYYDNEKALVSSLYELFYISFIKSAPTRHKKVTVGF